MARLAILALLVWLANAPVFADGKIFVQTFAEKVETPNQRAMIHFAGGVERLVIETSLSGAGTNFAWVLPLPAPPTISPVSEGFFPGLENAFRSKLIHHVPPYYAGVLFLCGLIFLGWRGMQDEVSWLRDLPVCLGLGAIAWFFGRGLFVAGLAFALAVYVRRLTGTPTNLALGMLVGIIFAGCITFAPSPATFGIASLGSDGLGEAPEVGVEIVSTQRAGVFESTTIRGNTSRAVLEWLSTNGYQTPAEAERVIRSYIESGWVFVATKVRRDAQAAAHATVHPLAFMFAVKEPVYPMRLTGIENSVCAIDLYVFGEGRASAKHFRVARCDAVARPKERRMRCVRIADSEVWNLIGASTAGTKLSGRLTPEQMREDTRIEIGRFSRTGARVYSRHAAGQVALNIGILASVGAWFLIGLSRGGWDVTERNIMRWRAVAVAAAFALSLATYVVLPKTEVVPTSPLQFADE